jgi:hypothetical protein
MYLSDLLVHLERLEKSLETDPEISFTTYDNVVLDLTCIELNTETTGTIKRGELAPIKVKQKVEFLFKQRDESKEI